MASWTLLDIAVFLNRWSAPVFCLVSLVFAILILAGKNKNLKLLGLGSVFGLGNTLATYIRTSIPYLYEAGVLDKDFYADGRFTTVSIMLGLTMFAFTVVTLVLRWLYTRRVYGTRISVLITVLVLLVLGPASRLIINPLVANYQGSSEYTRATTYAGVFSSLFAMAATAVFLTVFLKNRNNEKAIPSYWIYFMLCIVADIISGLITIEAVDNGNSDNFFLLVVIIRTLLGFINPAFNIYLFIGSRKTEDGI